MQRTIIHTATTSAILTEVGDAEALHATELHGELAVETVAPAAVVGGRARRLDCVTAWRLYGGIAHPRRQRLLWHGDH
jgi:hypothetical protein